MAPKTKAKFKNIFSKKKCALHAVRYGNLVLIFMTKELLKIKVELDADTFYNKVIDGFAKKKRTIPWFTNKF